MSSYSWVVSVNGERLASGSGDDQAFVTAEGFRYLWQYAQYGEAKLVIKCGRKIVTRVQAESVRGFPV